MPQVSEHLRRNSPVEPASPKPRVFVSSVIKDFGGLREAARRGIASAGCEPVLIEDSPSSASSPRNACLDGVASCDAVVVIVGERGGWTTPSGKLVVEEEYEHARGLSIPTLVFLHETKRDTEGERLAKKLSEFVNGNFRRTFKDPAELRREVEAACKPLTASAPRINMEKARFDHLLAKPYDVGHETVLRIVIATGRPSETVVEVETLDAEEFKHEFVGMGVAREVGLFHRNRQRSEGRGRNSLVVLQGEAQGSPPPGQAVRVEMFEDGWLVIDINVTGTDENSRRDPMAGFGLYPVEVEAIQERAATALRFARSVFEKLDPHGRHVGLLCNASLGSLNNKPLVFRKDSERYKGHSGGFFGRGDERVPISFDRPEKVSRADAGWVDALAEKIAKRLERRLNTEDTTHRS
jgi:hypothetical protein